MERRISFPSAGSTQVNRMAAFVKEQYLIDFFLRPLLLLGKQKNATAPFQTQTRRRQEWYGIAFLRLFCECQSQGDTLNDIATWHSANCDNDPAILRHLVARPFSPLSVCSWFSSTSRHLPAFGRYRYIKAPSRLRLLTGINKVAARNLAFMAPPYSFSLCVCVSLCVRRPRQLRHEI